VIFFLDLIGNPGTNDDGNERQEESGEVVDAILPSLLRSSGWFIRPLEHLNQHQWDIETEGDLRRRMGDVRIERGI
jgi:hypothetical protein